MELAEGGDLFDKIESDVGVGEDIAHFYFTQLISAVSYMHSKGVGHRDIKPENILLSAEGNLKIADFGLATLFEYKGVQKLCHTSCGSPPYTAPEVVTCNTRSRQKIDQGYSGNFVDIWSCGVVLFVLLVGNTPWDEPLDRSFEFDQYVKTNGRPDDELWHNLPPETLSLLRGMMRVNPQERYSLAEIRRHPWFTRENKYLSSEGKLENSVALATQMFESMKIDFSQDPMASQTQRSEDAMDVDSHDLATKLASTQPETPTNDIMFDWERPPRFVASNGVSASQPSTRKTIPLSESNWDERLTEEPSFSQFSATPQVPLSKTQYARQFRDIIPSHSLTRFFSLWSVGLLHSTITEALHRLGVPTSASALAVLPATVALGRTTWIKIRTTDTRNCPMSGDIVIENMTGLFEQLLEVNFVKAKGDPLEWRRLFKKVVVLCKDAVYKPDEQSAMLE